MLARLGPKDLGRLLRDAFQSDRLADELGWRIAEKSDGNPFFVFEIIRGLQEGQFLARRPDGVWETTKIVEEIQVPSSVLDLVHARVADLAQDEQELLEVASCCGFEFDPVLVAEAAGVGRIPALKMFGRIEKSHRLVRSAGRRLVFDHHQVAEALYQGILEPLREAYHGAIAEALESRAGAEADDPRRLGGELAVEICQHHFQAAQGDRALRYLDAALDHLGASYLNDRAIQLADQALETEGLLAGRRRCEVLLQKEGRLALMGRRDEQAAVLAEAEALAKEAGLEGLASKVEGALGNLDQARGRYADAEAHLLRSRDLARVSDERRAEAAAIGDLGSVLLSVGRFEEGRAHHEESLTLTREIEDRHAEAAATGNLGDSFLHLGRYEEAIERYERQLALAGELEDRRIEAAASGNLGRAYLYVGRLPEAVPRHERQLEISREIGDRQSEASVNISLGNVFLFQNRFGEAEPHFDRAREIALEIGHRQLEAAATASLGTVLYSLGRFEEARERYGKALAAIRALGNRQNEGAVLVYLGNASRALGQHAEAMGQYEQCLAISREIGDPELEVSALMGMGQAAKDLDEIPDACAHYADAVAASRSLGTPGTTVAAACHLAALSKSEEHVEAARSTFAEFESRLDPGRKLGARYLLWKATDAADELREAKRLLDEVVESAPEADREALLRDVELHREVMEAWKAL